MSHQKIDEAIVLLARVKHNFKRGLSQCDDLLEIAVFADPANLFDSGNLQDSYLDDGGTPFAGRELAGLEQP